MWLQALCSVPFHSVLFGFRFVPVHPAKNLVDTLVAKLDNILKSTADGDKVRLPKESVSKLDTFLLNMGKLVDVAAVLDKEVKNLREENKILQQRLDSEQKEDHQHPKDDSVIYCSKSWQAP